MLHIGKITNNIEIVHYPFIYIHRLFYYENEDNHFIHHYESLLGAYVVFLKIQFESNAPLLGD